MTRGVSQSSGPSCGCAEPGAASSIAATGVSRTRPARSCRPSVASRTVAVSPATAGAAAPAARARPRPAKRASGPSSRAAAMSARRERGRAAERPLPGRGPAIAQASATAPHQVRTSRRHPGAVQGRGHGDHHGPLPGRQPSRRPARTARSRPGPRRWSRWPASCPAVGHGPGRPAQPGHLRASRAASPRRWPAPRPGAAPAPRPPPARRTPRAPRPARRGRPASRRTPPR